jgi:hypothetical protein
MEKKTRVKGFSDNGVVWEGQKDFDQTYKSIKIVDYAVKVGEADEDYVIMQKVVEEETPIQEVIDADKESVGVYNIIKQVIRTGDESLLPRDDGKCQVDMVGAPETLMEVKNLGIQAEQNFNNLPGELTNGMDMTAFVQNMTQDQFDAFVKAIADRSSGKENKENE